MNVQLATLHATYVDKPASLYKEAPSSVELFLKLGILSGLMKACNARNLKWVHHILSPITLAFFFWSPLLNIDS